MIKKLKYENWKDGESSHEAFLCNSEDHINNIRNCFAKKKHFFVQSENKSGKYNNHKFHQAWKLIEKLNAVNPLKHFLKNMGDNKEVPYLFASVFFNCHTQETIDFIVNAVGSNGNLQNRHPIQFAYDLITGWIPEVIMVSFGLKKSGCDSDYKLQKGKSINSSEDFILGNQSVELTMDYTDIINNKNKFNLRYDKWNSLLEEESYLLILCTKSWEYYFYPAFTYAERLKAEYRDRIEAWSTKTKSTKGYELSGWKNIDSKPLTRTNLMRSFDWLRCPQALLSESSSAG